MAIEVSTSITTSSCTPSRRDNCSSVERSPLGLALSWSTDVSPRSVRVMKRQLWEAPNQSLGEVIALANAEMVTSLRSDDFQEGVRHFVEKLPARFTGS
jgi:enoyl-CoA hydratase/carnithine racemase